MYQIFPGSKRMGKVIMGNRNRKASIPLTSVVFTRIEVKILPISPCVHLRFTYFVAVISINHLLILLC